LRVVPTDASARDGAPEGEPEMARVAARARLGSSTAFEELVREFAPRLHRFLVVRLAGERDARDVLQETLIAAWQGLPGLRNPERVWPWLAGIAANKAADALRRRPPPALAEVERPVPDSSADVELKGAIDALPGHLREVVLLRFLMRLSEEEAADALGVRVGTIKSRTARARERLGESLDRGVRT
jgi:RNA polymerase sigma-70 factor, ECF subfamily